MLAGRSPHVVAAWRLQAENTSCLHVVMSDPKWHQGIIPAQSAAQALARDMLPELGQIPVRYEQYELMLELLDWCPDATRERWRSAIEKNMEAFTYGRRGPEPKATKLVKARGPAQVIDDVLTDETEDERQRRKAFQFALAYGASTERLASITGRMASDHPSFQNLPKEEPMTKPTQIIEITTKHFINGRDVYSVAIAEVWQLIADAEKQVKDLEQIEAKPASLIEHIAKIKASITELVKFLDEKKVGQ